MKQSFFSLFSGFGLADVGAKQAGLECIGGIEYSAEIAEVARANGHAATTANVCDVDFRKFDRPTHLWMSPVCTRASVANSSGEESELDTDCAAACCRAIAAWMPEFVFLENVYGYRHFKAFKLILHELELRGYGFDYWNLNAADYGVPQTRRRLILIARRDGLKPQRPMTTHSRDGDMFYPKWRGWYEAIEDLIPNLPESEFADWQLARLPVFALRGDFLQMTGNTQLESTRGTGIKNPYEPSNTVASNSTRNSRAFIASGMANDRGQSLTTRDDGEPVFTVNAQCGGRQATRAWLQYGRVVKMTPRALARFQSLPDSYELPDSAKLACTGIGNGIPCLFAQRIIESVQL